MGAENQEVQPFAWLPNGILPGLLRNVRVLRMPAPIHKALRSLGKTDAEVPPISSLHDLLATLSYHIIAFAPYILRSEEDNPQWLYLRADQSINISKLKALIHAWLLANYPNEAQQIIASWQEPHWSWDEIDLHEDKHLQPLLLPGLIARALLEKDSDFQLTFFSKEGPTQSYVLRPVPLMSLRNAAELITEPQRDENGAYSYVLRFWMQDVPQKGMGLFGRVSTRRWFITPVATDTWTTLKFNRNKGVYLRHSSGYLEDADTETEVFSRIRVRQLGNGAAGLRWVGSQAKVFRALGLSGDFPEADALGSNPKAFLNKFLVIKNAGEREIGEIGAGIWSNDHRHIYSELSSYFASWAIPLPLWTRTKDGDSRHLGHSASQERLEEVDSQTRFDALKHLPTPHPARIEIYTDNTTVKAAILEEIGADRLYQDQVNANPLYITQNGQSDGECVLEIVQGTDPHLTDLLPEGTSPNNAGKAAATDSRSREISRRHPKTNQPTGALIALPLYHEMKGLRWRDPKQAIRLGLLDSGRVSQFINPNKGNYAYRLKNAIRDLLRALGYRLNPLYVKPEKSTLPDHLDILAFWTIQLNARNSSEKKVFLPLVLEVPSDTHDLHVYLPRETGSADLFCSLPEAIMGAVGVKTEFPEPEDTIAFFKDAMQQRKGNHPTLLILSDQNMRRVFFQYLNRQLPKSASTSLLGEYTIVPPLSLNGLLTNRPNVRVAQLRYSFHDEAPFCVPAGERSKYQGLYHHPGYPNLFYSLHNVGDRHISTDEYKLDQLEDSAVNPATMQIWLRNLQTGDSAAEWAGVVHRLRLESSHTNIPTRLPQPLHNVSKIAEYLSRYVSDDDEDEDTNLPE